MSIYRHPSLHCDGRVPSNTRDRETDQCAEWADVAGWDSREIRRNAKLLCGWTRSGGKDYCPKHNPRRGATP